jgi:Transglycosylase SLT domain
MTAGASALAAIVLMCGVGAALGGNAVRRGTAEARALAAAAEAARGPVDVETLSFGDPLSGPLRVVRGPGKTAPPPPAKPGRAETVSFGPGETAQVTVLRGGSVSPAGAPNPAPQTHSEKISFADPQQPTVMVVRGAPTPDGFSMYLFGPASGGELDRIAFAVDGVESRHGADPRMWRPELDGPQGPMQVGAAAAFDVGGGDRFDLQQNRRLGRAYLAQMFLRYGNWPDALAAYNWGPGNMDLWIGGGRRAAQLPLDVARYVARVMRDAVISNAGL